MNAKETTAAIHANAVMQAAKAILAYQGSFTSVEQIAAIIAAPQENAIAAKMGPRVGDEYRLTSMFGEPRFQLVRVSELVGDLVRYEILHEPQASGLFTTGAVRIDTFIAVYAPTAETGVARKKGVSLPDWMAYRADQRQMAEDEAREVAINDWQRGVLRSNEDAELEDGR